MAIDQERTELTALDELTALKRQREEIGQRVAVMNEKRGKVSEEVFQRVHAGHRATDNREPFVDFELLCKLDKSVGLVTNC